MSLDGVEKTSPGQDDTGEHGLTLGSRRGRTLTKVDVRRAGLQLGDAVELALVLPLENHDDEGEKMLQANC